MTDTATRVATRDRGGPPVVVGVPVAVAAVALGARFSLPMPGSDVPQSLQSLAVVLAGAFLGRRAGAGALLAYLLLGAAGVPVFADGAAGVPHLTGPTAGYLVGFVLAAWVVGWGVDSGLARSLTVLFVTMMTAHLLVLGSGWVRLAFDLGPEAALETGVRPFLSGAVWKSVAGAAVVAAWQRRRDGVRSRGTAPATNEHGVDR